MCYFITLALPATYEHLVRTNVPRGMQIGPAGNARLLRALPADFVTYYLMSGLCSCDLFSVAQPVQQPFDEAKQRAAYSSRGWSDAKIDRALAQKRRAQHTVTHRVGFRDDVTMLLQKLAVASPRVGVFVHFYDRGTDDAKLRIDRTEMLRLPPTAPPVPDCLYWLDPTPR